MFDLETFAFLRALAQRLITQRPFHTVVGDDAAAVALVVNVAHDGGCPDCRSRDWFVVGDRAVRCRRCARTLPAFRKTPLARMQTRPLVVLAALHAVHIASETPTARGFARSWGLDPKRALALLHKMRRGLMAMTPPNPMVIDVVLGSCAEDNACVVGVSDDDLVEDRVVAVHIDDGPPLRLLAPTTKKPARHLPLWVGRLRRWLSEHFRGVTRRHLWLYLAEFTDRHGRVRWLTG